MGEEKELEGLLDWGHLGSGKLSFPWRPGRAQGAGPAEPPDLFYVTLVYYILEIARAHYFEDLLLEK